MNAPSEQNSPTRGGSDLPRFTGYKHIIYDGDCVDHGYFIPKQPIPKKQKVYTEEEVRKMRDTIFGQVSSDKNWKKCKKKWMKQENILWLERGLKLC